MRFPQSAGHKIAIAYIDGFPQYFFAHRTSNTVVVDWPGLRTSKQYWEQTQIRVDWVNSRRKKERLEVRFKTGPTGWKQAQIRLDWMVGRFKTQSSRWKQALNWVNLVECNFKTGQLGGIGNLCFWLSGLKQAWNPVHSMEAVLIDWIESSLKPSPLKPA